MKHTKEEIELVGDVLKKMRNIFSAKCKHYIGDLAIDVEIILTDFYGEYEHPAYYWSVGEYGTHLSEEDAPEHLLAVLNNYYENDFYYINLDDGTFDKLIDKDYLITLTKQKIEH